MPSGWGSDRQADLRLQPQQRPDRLYPHRRIRPQPGLLHHYLPVDGYPDFLQPRASPVPPVGGGRRPYPRWFASLAETGRYAVSPDVQEKLQAEFWGGFCDDQAAAEAIHGQFDRYGYLCDPHTAVAVKVFEDYVRETGDDTRTIIASTASPYKFCGSVLPAVTREPVPEDPFAQMELLHQVSGMAPPASLAGLKGRPVRFTGSIEKGQMADKVKEMLR